KDKGLQLPTVGKNLFIDLMEKRARELKVTSCWICGGSQMAEQWPWRGESVSPEGLLVWNRTHITREKRPEGWVLSHLIIGQICISRDD
ncbi:ENR1 protein, partial [Baryphthengus martii]|nr:ENR1 protein [Baryphthengus martii]